MLTYDRKKLGEYLKAARERADLSQMEVAEALGYTSPQFISNIERGTSVAPLKTLAKMISLYKQKPDQMLKIILDSQRKFLAEKLRRA